MSLQFILSHPVMMQQTFLQDEYCTLAKQTNGRLQYLTPSEEINPQAVYKKDVEEAQAIAQLFFAGASHGLKSFTEGNLKAIDVVLGDHNCHIPALLALAAYNNNDLQAEGESLLEVIKKKRGKALKLTGTPAEVLLHENNRISLPNSLKYIIYASILKIGTTCTENRNGTMVLKVELETIQQRLSKNCSLDLLSKLVPRMRNYVHTQTVQAIKILGRHILSNTENDCLNRIQTGTSPQGYVFDFPCAFYNMKATLQALINAQIPFAIVKYEPILCLEPSFIFACTRETTEFVNPTSLSQRTPFFVIQGFFSENLSTEEVGQQIKEYGLYKLILDSVATNPQFTDMKPVEYENNEDINQLPDMQKEEILKHRKDGRQKPTFFKIAHTFATTVKGGS